MSVKKIHLFPSEESYVANSGSVEADDVALVPLVLAPVAKSGGTGLVVVVLLVNRSRIKIIPLW